MDQSDSAFIDSVRQQMRSELTNQSIQKPKEPVTIKLYSIQEERCLKLNVTNADDVKKSFGFALNQDIVVNKLMYQNFIQAIYEQEDKDKVVKLQASNSSGSLSDSDTNEYPSIRLREELISET